MKSDIVPNFTIDVKETNTKILILKPLCERCMKITDWSVDDDGLGDK